MGGLVVDIFVEYLYRVLARWVKMRGSGGWPRAKATVMSSACPPAGYGCTVAEVYYKYYVDGEIYTDIHEKPFMFLDSGTDYAKQKSPGMDLTIRLKPGDPSISFVREEDQGLPGR